MNVAQIPASFQIAPRLAISRLQLEALRLLSQAWDAAARQALDVWQFAVEIERLHAVGLDNTDLRELLCLGYLKHGRERTSASAAHRVFQPLGTLILPERTCFVLSEKGREVVAALDLETELMVGSPTSDHMESHGSLMEAPHWEIELRQLWWQECLIKEFRRPAVNQETVLAVFEEEGWPPRIDDPLPVKHGIDPKVRLHDTIKSLNQHHHFSIIKFRGDGSGTGIVWKMDESL